MIKCVVPISGGKDSQACLKLALREFDASEILGLFCDTQFEHTINYQHIATIRRLYGVRIKTITAGSVPEKVLKYGRFPGSGARHCTEELKIVPSKKFYKALAEQQGGFQVWYGMRSEESAERKARYRGKVDTELYAPHDVLKKYPKYLEKMGVQFRLPVIDMSKSEIFAILNGEENPLYAVGFDRVGCFPCLASGDRNKERAFGFDEFGKQQRVIVIKLEREIGKSVFTSIGGAMRNNENQKQLFDGCAICAM
jgi:3'-phosphoadenosine 5'-phosphosulfate sulfotransferase (PAPS reductase)/FAD synthetase